MRVPPRTADDTPRRRAIDAEAILRELSQRWAAARTLEYRSRAVLTHAGELRVVVAIHTRLRRPNLARVLFDADRPEVTRLRVCDGRRVFDRTDNVPLRPASTLMEPFTGRITANLPHPLDELSYCADQFFAAAPFTPPARWGEPGQPRTIIGSVVPAANLDTRQRDVYRIVIARGHTRDTLTLEPISLRPLEIVRVGEHAGQVQELLRETFTAVSLGAYLPPSVFEWTEADDRGETLRAGRRRA
jgi:hypothetical protein